MGADDLPVHGYSSTESYPKKEEFGKGLRRSGGANHQEPEPGIEMTQKAAAGEVPFRGRLRGQMAEISAFIERLAWEHNEGLKGLDCWRWDWCGMDGQPMVVGEMPFPIYGHETVSKMGKMACWRATGGMRFPIYELEIDSKVGEMACWSATEGIQFPIYGLEIASKVGKMPCQATMKDVYRNCLPFLYLILL